MQKLFENHRWTRRDAIKVASLALIGGHSSHSYATSRRWVDQRQVGPFIYRSTFPLTEAETTQVGLLPLEAELRRILSLSPCRQNIEVLLYETQSEHRDSLKSKHPEAPYRRALYVKQGDRATVYAYKHAELAVDLRHECTHALLHADLPSVPLWLDEGLAEYFEATQAERPKGPSHLAALRWDLRLGRLKPLTDLESESELAEFGSDDYRFAWAWVHFMLHGPKEANEVLWAYLATIRRNEVPEKISALLQQNLPNPEKQLVAHFRNWPQVLRELTAKE